MRISNRRNTRARRAFTLAELLVAVGLVAVISLAIGSIFTGIQGVVSTGIATAEVDQLARALERQLRDDFDAFNRMRDDETFLAIRMREVGDWNRNDVHNAGNEVSLYLTREDEEADRIAFTNGGVTGAYAEGSRAVTRRVDEIMFIAPSSEGSAHFSAQLDSDRGVDRSGPNAPPRVNAVGAQNAIIYYGHGLRPAPDPNLPDDEDAVPVRQYYADGDFGQGPGQAAPNDENRFDLGTSPLATGRNEYAADWPLTRRPLLLLSCAVPSPEQSFSRLTSPIGIGREYAPYPRDYENLQVIDELVNVLTEEDLENDAFLTPTLNNAWPGARLVSWGRTDICNMSATDMRRWIEGEPANSNYPSSPATSQPFFCDAEWAMETGALAPLWQRSDQSTAESREIQNWVFLRSAIAGCFSRGLVETEPPRIDRRTPTDPSSPGRQPDDAMMDLHSIIAGNCSNFEIAWSDGATAVNAIDPDGDASNGILYQTGDTIWYDISSYDPDNPDRRSTAGEWVRLGNAGAGINFRLTADDFNDIEIEGQGNSVIQNRTEPAIGLNVPGGVNWQEAYYNPDLTGGVDPNTGQDEYLAIFPFRAANGGEGIDEIGFPKDILIRIRVTLHDSLKRLPEGKTFEFIFKLNPRGV